MRIVIDHAEIREGVVFKTTFHEVQLTVDFSHEEKQIISQRGLGEQLLLERVPAGARAEDNPEWYHLKIKHLVERKPDRHRCANPGDAKLYEAQLIAVLQQLKAWLEANADPAGRTVIEL